MPSLTGFLKSNKSNIRYQVDKNDSASESNDLMSPFDVGFEIEMAGCSFHSNVAKLNKFNDRGTPKQELSVSDGWEFASKIHKNQDFYSKCGDISYFDKLFKDFKSVGSIVDTRCGQHIHVSAMDISPRMMLKLNELIHSNREFIELVGERGEVSHCKFQKHNEDTIFNRNAGGYENYKYRYLNLFGKNLRTIEFRFFKSTLDLDIFLKNMQFVIALIEFCSQDKHEVNYFNHGSKHGLMSFLEFVDSRSDDFEELNSFLIKNNYYVESGEIVANRYVECFVYPNQKVIKAIERVFNGTWGGNRATNVQRLDGGFTSIQNIKNAVKYLEATKKCPNTLTYLNTVIEEAEDEGVGRVLFLFDKNVIKFTDPNDDENSIRL